MKKGFALVQPLPAHEAPGFDLPTIHAIKALTAGQATADQQVRFLEWFNRATGVDQNPYRPGDTARRETDLACGKKLVGDWFYAIAKHTPDQR